MQNTKKCLFCGKYKENRWKSNIRVMFRRSPIDSVTVCPDCRKTHTIQQLYEAMISAKMAEAEKIIKEQEQKRK